MLQYKCSVMEYMQMIAVLYGSHIHHMKYYQPPTVSFQCCLKICDLVLRNIQNVATTVQCSLYGTFHLVSDIIPPIPQWMSLTENFTCRNRTSHSYPVGNFISYYISHESVEYQMLTCRNWVEPNQNVDLQESVEYQMFTCRNWLMHGGGY